VERFGKPSGPLLRHKQTMFDENSRLLSQADSQAELYAAQPRRSRCKVCKERVDWGQCLVKGNHSVPYSICSECGHLNGHFEDTTEYNRELYAGEGGTTYGANYRPESAADFSKRVRDIYMPKVRFLLDAIPQAQVAQRFLDVGCGSGHMAQALMLEGIENVRGVDVGASQVALAGAMVPKASFETLDFEDLPGYILSYKPDYISLIGVLEHLQDPMSFIESVRECDSIRGVLISVPCYSLSVLVECAMPAVFPRQLAGGHTHLFTEQSLNFVVENSLGFEFAGTWWFGTDVVDLYRSLRICMGEQSGIASAELDRLLGPIIDDLQLVIDQARLSSEVHAALSRPG